MRANADGEGTRMANFGEPEEKNLTVVRDTVPVVTEAKEVAVPEPQTPALPSRDPYAGASVQPFDERACGILTAKIPDADIDILPTGELYVSQVRYRRILNDAFGVGGWALIPRGDLRLNPADKYMYQKWALYAHGRFISEAIGEQEYQETNARMSYAAAAEGAKSNALTRCCKDLGIASECWDKHFTNGFVAQYCIQVWREGKNKPEWRRIDSPPFYNERGPVKGERVDRSTSQAPPPPPPDMEDIFPEPSDSFQASSDEAVTDAQALSVTQWCRSFGVDFKTVFGPWFSVDDPRKMTEPQYVKWLEIRDRFAPAAAPSKDIEKAGKIVDRAMNNVRAQSTNTNGGISEGKQKRFWAICGSGGKSRDDTKQIHDQILAQFGFKSSAEIPWKGSIYDEICKAAEKAAS
jgi:hypothetical protein